MKLTSERHNWTTGLKYAEMYFNEFKNLNIPTKFVINNYRLGVWIANQRAQYRLGKLSSDRIEKLEKIKMIWRVKPIPHDVGK